jgi:hypothetical protein
MQRYEENGTYTNIRGSKIVPKVGKIVPKVGCPNEDKEKPV